MFIHRGMDKEDVVHTHTHTHTHIHTHNGILFRYYLSEIRMLGLRVLLIHRD